MSVLGEGASVHNTTALNGSKRRTRRSGARREGVSPDIRSDISKRYIIATSFSGESGATTLVWRSFGIVLPSTSCPPCHSIHHFVIYVKSFAQETLVAFIGRHTIHCTHDTHTHTHTSVLWHLGICIRPGQAHS